MNADPYGQATSGPLRDADLDALVQGLGALLGSRSATYAVRAPSGDARVVLRRWDSDEPADEPADEPGGGTGHRVTVPVSGDDGARGELTFVGPEVREPTEAELTLLRAVAVVVARGTQPPSALSGAAAASPPVGGTAVERTMALVDVFAFTVEVTGDEELEWRYFGPNSATVFGAPVSSDEALVPLVERHVHPDDLSAVRELEQAALAGRPLEVETRLLAADGTERWVSWRTVPRTVDGALHVDGVATDVSSRHSLGRSRRDLEQANEEYARQVDLRRRHALAVRDANDNVLQRIFAAGLRLRVLQRGLNDVGSHAAEAIAFQLDQAATDLRELILDLNAVIGGLPQPGRSGPPGR